MSNIEFISDDMNIDYTDLFYDTAQTSSKSSFKEKDPSKEGWVFDAMSMGNLGTTFFCLLPDRVLREGKPRAFRRVPNGFEGYVIDPSSDKGKRMKFQIPSENDFSIYKELDGEQKILLRDLRKQAKNFVEITSFENKGMFPEVTPLITIRDNYQTFFCFAKILSFVSTAGPSKNPKYTNGLTAAEIGHVRILEFTKGQSGLYDFGTTFNNVIKKRCAALKSVSWIKDYLSRCIGMRSKAFCMDVTASTVKPIRYSMSLSLEEVSPFEITQADLNIAENLDSAVYNITGFDENYYSKLAAAFEIVQNKIDGNTKIQMPKAAAEEVKDQKPEEEKIEAAPVHNKRTRAKLDIPQPDFTVSEEDSEDSDEEKYPF